MAWRSASAGAADPGGAVGRDVPPAAGEAGRAPAAGGRGTNTRGSHRAGPLHPAGGVAGVAAGGDQPCSAPSSGGRPGRAAPQAGAHAQRLLGEGEGWVVDLDLEQCFARVPHDTRMRRVQERVSDRRVVPRLPQRSRRCLNPPTRRKRDPYVRWGGRGEAVRPLPLPIAMTAEVKRRPQLFVGLQEVYGVRVSEAPEPVRDGG